MSGEDKILERLDSIDDKLSDVDERLTGVDESLSGVDGRLSEMDNRLLGVDGRLTRVDGTQDKVIMQLLEMKTYLHENVATKDELHKTKSEIMTHIDGFAQRQEKFDHEMVSMRLRVDRIEEEV